MAKVKIVDSPTEEIIKKSTGEVTIIDSNNRAIVLRKPNVLAQYKLVKVVGGDTAKNDIYMAMILPLIYVVSIDGAPVSINSEKELDAVILRLGEHGIEAVMKGLQEHFAINVASQEEANQEIKK